MHTNDAYIVTFGSSGLVIRLNGFTDELKGQTINFHADIDSGNIRVRLRILDGNTNISTGTYQTGETHHELNEITISDTVTNLNFRIEATSTDVSVGDTLKFKNWKIYIV